MSGRIASRHKDNLNVFVIMLCLLFSVYSQVIWRNKHTTGTLFCLNIVFIRKSPLSITNSQWTSHAVTGFYFLKFVRGHFSIAIIIREFEHSKRYFAEELNHPIVLCMMIGKRWLRACCLRTAMLLRMSATFFCSPVTEMVRISLSVLRFCRSRANMSLDALSRAPCSFNSSAMVRSHCTRHVTP